MSDNKDLAITGIGSVSKLKGAANYHDWRWQIEMVLRAKDMWHVVSGEDARPEGVLAASAWNKTASQALAIVVLTCESRIQTHIKTLRDPAAVLAKLDATFQPKGLAHIIRLRKEYHQFGARVNCDDIEDHISGLCVIADKRAAVGDAVAESDLVLTLLGSLPAAYDTLVTAIDQQREGIPDLEWVRVKILEEQSRQKTRIISENV
ncbi:hypothetical protein CF319_g9513 [Tilletia indica]|nr:hypothetical protein CF319_g9513 [Tilletia indica]